ncbi:LD-carboxypeptidase [Mangrovibacterium marinum]|uniref:Muramoyltetrapeptide carboxypeptidase n=1 Tax=Mangrovibacterium marinum TaxID=1639118 RepID=A0A2T5C6W7_9BACT|nr:LD-carboxypeptidase [Mangrovibacterium marinum]PTN10699.1 muramoyltetrapeptide carboxypeptidase [Mangrovibacterium marinum]
MIKPPFLKAGDRIRIISPAGKVNRDKIWPGLELLRAEGYDLVQGKHVFGNHFQFAATDQQRLSDLQEALDDPQCKAIICSRGGYGSVRIADQLNFRRFRENPKWLVGFSDITVLHAYLQKEGFCSIHGPMPGFYQNENQPTTSFRQLMQLLTGKLPAYSLAQASLNRPGQATGELCGGNLSIIYSLLGTPQQVDTTNKILFIEDLSEYLYQLDRMMHSLKLSGSLKNLKALLVGSFTDMKDNSSPFGSSVEEIIFDAIKEYDYPVFFNCPSGHIDENRPLLLGHRYSLANSAGEVTLSPLPD